MAALYAFLTADFLGTATWLWLAFLGIVLALLIFDLGVLHRDQHEIEMRESLLLYGGYFSVGVLFGVYPASRAAPFRRLYRIPSPPRPHLSSNFPAPRRRPTPSRPQCK